MIRRPTCPICHKLLPVDTNTDSKLLPFCSQRCRQVDFFRWCDGKYALVEPLDPEQIDSDPATEDFDE